MFYNYLYRDQKIIAVKKEKNKYPRFQRKVK